MPILETIAFAIGPTIAKFVVKSFLDDGLIAEISGAAIDLLKDSGKKTVAERRQTKQLDSIAKEVAKRIQTIFRHVDISKESRTNSVQEFALTLAQTPIDSEQLIQFNLDSKRLNRHLLAQRPDATHLFSQVETDYYERLLREAANAIMDIATDVVGFERHYAKRMLLGQDELLEKVARLLQYPNEEAQEFEQRYCRAVCDKLDKLETFGLPKLDRMTSRQSLSVAYITLEASRTVSRQLSLFAIENEERNRIAHGHKIVSKELLASSIEGIFARSRRVVVRGYAGSGKSTLLQWIAVRAAFHDFPDSLVSLNNTVPFFIRLREHVKSGFPNTEEFPIGVAHMLVGDMPRGWVHDQLDSGRAIVLVDGVDELPKKMRNAMLDSLRQLVAAYPYVRYVVTSRPAAIKAEGWPEWQAWVDEEGFVETALQPMSVPQIDTFIDHWYKALDKTIIEEVERDELKNYPDDLKRLLRRRPPMRRLATTPLLCAMICALYRERQQNLPSERIELYRACVEMLLTRRDEGRKIERETDYPNLSATQMLALMQNFAYWLLQNDYSDVELEEADVQFDQWLTHMDVEATGEAVRHLFVERTGLLREPVDGRVDFTHRTFQEYLAAQAAIKENDIGVLVQKALNDLWRETIILAVGEARPKERERLLLNLLKRGDRLKKRQNRYQVYMLAIASLETATELSPEVRERVLEKARGIIPPWDDDEVKLIAAAGDPVVPLLDWNEQYAPSRAALCVEVLAAIGSKKALQMLAKYRDDDRYGVQDVLGRAWNKFDIPQFANALFREKRRLVLSDLTVIRFLDEPAQWLPNLRQLMLNSDQLRDINILAELPNLTHLEIISNQLSDISTLAELLNLTHLELWNAQLSDIRVLAQLPNLTQLTLISNQLSDISVLMQLPNLTHLMLSTPQLNDISMLAQLPNLTHLGFIGAELRDIISIPQISDISVLAQLPNLIQLEINSVQLNDISVLAQLPNLTQLMLSIPRLSDISVLAQLPNLTQLMLWNAQLSVISVLAQLPNLKQFTLSSNQLGDISVLAQLPNLAQLTLNSDQLSNISVLAQLPNLTQLALSSNQLSDLSVLAQLPNLTELDISSNQLGDISVLAQLPNLTQLTLGGAQLSDISVLTQLPNLTQLTLWRNQVSDISLLRELSHSIEIRIFG